MAAIKSGVTLADLLPDLKLPSSIGKFVPSDITLDSRQVVDGGIFCALDGHTVKREHYVPQAIHAGAAVILRQAHDGVARVHDSKSNACIVIELADLRGALGAIASRFFNQPSAAMTIVGVTGTNGKTSCVELIAQCLRFLGQKTASLGTLGWSVDNGQYHSTGLTTLDAVENQRVLARFREQNIAYVAMEVSSHGIAQQRIAGIDYAYQAFTNLSRDHLDFHTDMQSYAEVKASFFNSDAVKIVNSDDATGALIASRHPQCFTYSLRENSNAPYKVQSCDLSAAGIKAKIQTPTQRLRISAPLIGEFNLSNLLIVIAVLEQCGFSKNDIEAALSHVHPVVGRLEKVIAGGKTPQKHVYIDYAHTPDALKQALLALREHYAGRLIVVFGCGGDRDRGKRPLMAEVAQAFADTIIVTSDNPRTESPQAIIDDIVAGLDRKNDFYCEINRSTAISLALSLANEYDVVLIAGKGHENYQEINGVRTPFSDYDEVARHLKS